ncbi:MAG: hypothetical protein H0W36_00910 [Gemmatimonadetes bacterium]|nr:hypothetical protein [Gemmatimonadota bacterium]
MRRIDLLLACLGVAVLTSPVGAPRLEGHGESIRLGAGAVAAGDSLAVTGAGFGSRRAVKIALEGAALAAALVTVQTDAQGRFSLAVTIPSEAPPGSYHIVARAGEDRAEADFIVTEPPAAGTGGGPVPATVLSDRARADAMPLERRRRASEAVAAWSFFVLLVAVGFWLSRSGRRSSEGARHNESGPAD